MPKKRFIDPKRSITFVLGSRDQKDPLIADETAPQHVLIPVGEKQKEEQRKFGIYFDDDYDYLRHLKSSNDAPVTWDEVKKQTAEKRKAQNETAGDAKSKLMLPSSVFQSEHREKVGMLNKAAPISGPRLDWDPDLVEAMDDDFNFDDPENQIEDDFIQLAEGPAPECEEGEQDSDDDDDDEFDLSDCSSDFDLDEEDGHLQQKFETKSRFTEYSVTSSVMRRNAGLTLVDEQFEKLYEEYDVEKGDLFDPCDVEARLEYEELLAEGFKPSKLLEMIEASKVVDAKREKVHLDQTDDVEVKEFVKNFDHTKEEEMEVHVVEEPSEKWDCQSILSTYSNLYNRPKVVMPPKKTKAASIQVSEKSGLPKGVIGKTKLTAKNLAKLGGHDSDDDCAHSVDMSAASLSVRDKDETPDERKERKRLLKEYQRERRKEKKMNKVACKMEKESQKGVMMNIRQNMQGMKLA